MILRVLAGIVLVALAAVFITLGGWWLNIGLILVACIGQWEVSRALRQRYASIPVWQGYAFIILSLPVIYFFGADGLVALFALMVFLTLVAAVWRSECPLGDAMAGVFSLCYPALPFTFFIVLNEMAEPELISRIGIVLAIVAAVLADIFGLLVGMTFGRHQLCPQISPKKTVEGAVGSLVASTLGSVGLGILFIRYITPAIALWQFAILGFLMAVAAITGDLIASAIKRFCGVKDFGKIIPGHGGIMDRFDSILFTATLVVCFYTFANMF